MNGSAPNSSNTGSQVELSRNPQPNFRMEPVDSTARTHTMETNTASNANAKPAVRPRNSRSPMSGRRRMRGACAAGTDQTVGVVVVGVGEPGGVIKFAARFGTIAAQCYKCVTYLLRNNEQADGERCPK